MSTSVSIEVLEKLLHRWARRSGFADIQNDPAGSGAMRVCVDDLRRAIEETQAKAAILTAAKPPKNTRD